MNVSLNPRTCAFVINVTQRSYVEGGTGLFANASGTFRATLTARGVFALNADRSCAVERAPLFEVDTGHATSAAFTY